MSGNTQLQQLEEPLLSGDDEKSSQPHTTPLVRMRSSASFGGSSKKDPFSKAVQDLIESEAVVFDRKARAIAIIHCSKGVVVGWGDGSVEMLDFPSTLQGSVRAKNDSKQFVSVTCLQARRSYLVAGYKDGSVRRWHLDTQEVQEGFWDSKGVICLHITPDEQRVVTGSEDNKARVHLMDTLEVLSVYEFHSNWISSFVITPDGNTLVSASFDNTLKLWNPKDLEHTDRLLGKHDDWVTCLAISKVPKDFHIFSGSSDKSMCIWSLIHCELLHKLTGHSSTITCIAISPDGNRAVTGSHDTTARLWTLDHIEQESRVMYGHTDTITCVGFTPYARMIITGSNDESLRAWRTADLRPAAVSWGNKEGVSCFAVTPDGKKVYSGCENSVRIYGQVDDTTVATLGMHSGVTTCLDVTQDGRFIVSGSEDRSISIYDMTTRQISTIEKHAGVVTHVAISPDRRSIISSSWDNTLRILDTETRAEKVLSGHTDWVNTFEISRDGTTIVSASADKTVRVWNLYTAKSQEFLGHTDMVTCLVITLDGQRVVSGARDRTVRVWSLNDLQEMAGMTVLHPNWVTDVKITPDQQLVVSACWDFHIRIWPLFNPLGVDDLEGHTAPISCLVVCPDNKFAISGSWDKTIRVWNVIDKHPVHIFQGHTGLVTCLAVTMDPNVDEKVIISGSEDSTVRVWSLNHMREVTTIMAEAGTITSLVATPDCTRVISGTELGVVQTVNMMWVLPWLRNRMFNVASSDKPPCNSMLGMHIEEFINGSFVEGDVMHLFHYPHYFNVVHLSAYFNRSAALVRYLESGAKIVKSSFGTPFTLAFYRRAGKCVDILLDHIIGLLQQNKGWLVVQEITDDLPTLMAHKSQKIKPFVALLFRKAGQNPIPDYIVPGVALPNITFSRFGYIQPRLFSSTAPDGDQEPVQFKVCEFQWNFTNGSAKSLEFLGHLENCQDTTLMTTDLARSLVEVKWKYFWHLILTLTLMYTLLLFCLICLTFNYFDDTLMSGTFLILNVGFMVLEVLQSLGDLEYWIDPWNYLDLLRGTAAILWIVFFRNVTNVRAFVVCSCFFRGFTYFRAFQMTRMFVRMTFQVINEVQSFLVIMVYSTFSFGMMNASLNLDDIPDVVTAWQNGYELLMGAFDNEGANFFQWLCFTFATFGNVVLLLNLLVSILGDAYGKVQETSQENDTLEMLRILLEYESLMFWRRDAGEALVMLECREAEDEEDEAGNEKQMESMMDTLKEEIHKATETVQEKILEGIDAKIEALKYAMQIHSVAQMEEPISK